MLRIETRHAPLPEACGLRGILVTSGNALEALPAAYHPLPLLAVGGATARRAARAGFVQVESAGGDAEDLAALLRRCLRPADGTLLLASGEGQGQELAATLRGEGYRVIRRVTYAAIPAPALPAEAAALLRYGTAHVALFFSAETARAYVRVVQRAGLGTALTGSEAVAIGGAASMALETLPWRRIRVAERPTQDEMLALLR